MNFEKAWNALMKTIVQSNDYHDFKKGEIAALMLRCLVEPDAVLVEIKEAEDSRKIKEVSG